MKMVTLTGYLNWGKRQEQIRQSRLSGVSVADETSGLGDGRCELDPDRATAGGRMVGGVGDPGIASAWQRDTRDFSRDGDSTQQGAAFICVTNRRHAATRALLG